MSVRPSPILFPLLCALCVCTIASAQTPSTSPAREPGSDLAVAVLTMAPGDAVYEWFGHNAILIENTRTGRSYCFNYGLFDPGQHGFILRFLQGRMDYWMGAFTTEETIDEYRKLNRTVTRQDLDLTPTQRVALWNYLEWNQRKENATYRYDYYTANCSTKVRDVLDLLLEGQLKNQLQAVQTGKTYRWHTRAASRRNPVMLTAIDYLLGPPTDAPLDAWDDSFLPEQLAQHLKNVRLTDSQGKEVPLVISETVVFQADRKPAEAGPPRWIAGYLILGVLIGAGLYALSRSTDKGRKWRVAFAALAGCWVLLIAGMGTFLAGTWALTSHAATYRNENLFQVNPLALPLVLLAPLTAMGKRWGSSVAWWAALAMLGLSAVGLIVQALPSFDQVNGEIIAWLLPAHAGLFLAIDRLTRNGRSVAGAAVEQTESIKDHASRAQGR